MKKIIALATVMIMVVSAFALTGCSSSDNGDLSNSKYVGTWKATTLSLQDESEDLGSDLTMVLKEDGTGELKDDSETSSFTWTLTDSGFKTKGDVKLKFKDDGDNIKTTIIGVDMAFEKVD